MLTSTDDDPVLRVARAPGAGAFLAKPELAPSTLRALWQRQAAPPGNHPAGVTKGHPSARDDPGAGTAPPT